VALEKQTRIPGQSKNKIRIIGNWQDADVNDLFDTSEIFPK
jgi:hypothetical protein